MIRLIVNLPEEQSERLRVAADKLGIKKSSLAKVAIDQYLKESEDIE